MSEEFYNFFLIEGFLYSFLKFYFKSPIYYLLLQSLPLPKAQIREKARVGDIFKKA